MALCDLHTSPHISTLRNTGVQMPESSSFIQLPGWGGSQTTSIRIPYSVLEDLEAYGTGGAQGVPDRTYPTIDAIASAGRAGTSTSPRHIESQLERVKHERELWLGASRVSGKHGHLGNHGTLMNFMNFKKFGFIMGKQRVWSSTNQVWSSTLRVSVSSGLTNKWWLPRKRRGQKQPQTRVHLVLGAFQL